jgi:hypothetical protein
VPSGNSNYYTLRVGVSSSFCSYNATVTNVVELAVGALEWIFSWCLCCKEHHASACFRPTSQYILLDVLGWWGSFNPHACKL